MGIYYPNNGHQKQKEGNMEHEIETRDPFIYISLDHPWLPDPLGFRPRQEQVTEHSELVKQGARQIEAEPS